MRLYTKIFMFAATMFAGGLGYAAAPITGDWCFEKGDLTTSVGKTLEYFDGAEGETAKQTKFGKASDFGLPPAGGADVAVMKFPACSPEMGYRMYPQTQVQGTTGTLRYTMMMDLYMPELPKKFGALINTSADNANDGEFFVNAAGGLGVAGKYSGRMKAGRWHRVVWTMNDFVLRKYVDGMCVGIQKLEDTEKAEWGLRPSKGVLLFADEDNETMTGYAARVQVRDGVLTPAEVDGLGALSRVEPELLTAPFLQDMRTTGMTIMWETATADEGYVEYGTTTEYGAKQTSTMVKTDGASVMHTAVLSGLKPGTKYHYRVINPTLLSGRLTQDATFETAPDAVDGDFSFGFWSDSQGMTSGSLTEPTVSIFKYMVDAGVNFAVTSGDLSEDGSQSDMVRPYFIERVCKYIGTKIPFFIAWGNHDGYGLDPAPALSYIRQCATMPSKYRTDLPNVVSAGRGCFTYSYRGVFFVFIDDAHFDDLTNGWLDAALSTLECKNARMRIAIVHVPPFCEMWMPGSEVLRKELVPRMEAAGFSLCLSGHTHEYERGALNGVNYVIAGGSSWLDLTEPIVQKWDHFTVGGKNDMDGAPRAGLLHNFVLFGVKGDELTGTMHTFDATGKYTGVKDTFRVSMPAKK